MNNDEQHITYVKNSLKTKLYNIYLIIINKFQELYIILMFLDMNLLYCINTQTEKSTF